MTLEEKIALLEDMLELEGGTLLPEECGKKLTGEEIRTFKTVGDILAAMGE